MTFKELREMSMYKQSKLVVIYVNDHEISEDDYNHLSKFNDYIVVGTGHHPIGTHHQFSGLMIDLVPPEC